MISIRVKTSLAQYNVYIRRIYSLFHGAHAFNSPALFLFSSPFFNIEAGIVTFNIFKQSPTPLFGL